MPRLKHLEHCTDTLATQHCWWRHPECKDFKIQSFWLKNFSWMKPFSKKIHDDLLKKKRMEKNMVATTRVRLYFYVYYTRSATKRQTVMVDINLLLSHFPRFLVCFATTAAELWRIGPNPDISLTSNIPSLTSSNKVGRVVQAWWSKYLPIEYTVIDCEKCFPIISCCTLVNNKPRPNRLFYAFLAMSCKIHIP